MFAPKNNAKEPASQADIKAAIRRKIRAQRRQLTSEWISLTSATIQQQCLALPEWPAAQNICCYLAEPTEVQTGQLLAAAWQANKKVWVPAYHPQQHYRYVPLERQTVLTVGHWNINEPANPLWQDPQAIDLALIPGLAFDSQGGRLGHGKGYYDSLLAEAALLPARKIGLAFDFQLQDKLPLEIWDVAMDIIVTDQSVIRCEIDNK